ARTPEFDRGSRSQAAEVGRCIEAGVLDSKERDVELQSCGQLLQDFSTWNGDSTFVLAHSRWRHDASREFGLGHRFQLSRHTQPLAYEGLATRSRFARRLCHRSNCRPAFSRTVQRTLPADVDTGRPSELSG